MKTRMGESVRGSAAGAQAEAVLRRCVHCGFCNSVCPTYRVLGDERNGPRGRIYQMKEFWEDGEVDSANLRNLDLCLTCQACESACPSGVAYFDLLEKTRGRLAQKVGRRWWWRTRRRLAAFVLTDGIALLRRLLATLARLPAVVPKHARHYLPPRSDATAATDTVANVAAGDNKRKVLLFDGCAQSASRPDINQHTQAVLARLNIGSEQINNFCCGALPLHLELNADAKQRIRRNVATIYEKLQAGYDAVVSTASGCGRTIADYGNLLADDSEYAERARAVSAAHYDIAELLSGEDLSALQTNSSTVAFHCPCTLKHGQKKQTAVVKVFSQLGIDSYAPSDNEHCCGSAGFYAVENAQMAATLRTQRLSDLQQNRPDTILTANIGCLLHLQSGTDTPVKHWIQQIKI